MAAFKSYRLFMTKNVSGNQGYFAVTLWRMTADEEGVGANLLVGGTASASHTNGSHVPANAFDGNPSTTWESPSTPNRAKWLRYDLPEPVEVRSIYVSHTQWAGEGPQDFALQGSNDDGVTWEDISVFSRFLVSGVTSKTSSIVRNVRGTSVLADGRPASQVRLYSWVTGELISVVTPSSTGAWSFSLQRVDQLLVVHIPAGGYRPLADGPIDVYPSW